MSDQEGMAVTSGGKLRTEEVVADWRGDKNLGQSGCNKLGKVERKVQCCFLVEEWMCGGKYKPDPENNTVIFLAWECGGESGNYHSGIYQGPSIVAIHVCCGGVVHSDKGAHLENRSWIGYEQLCTFLRSLKDSGTSNRDFSGNLPGRMHGGTDSNMVCDVIVFSGSLPALGPRRREARKLLPCSGLRRGPLEVFIAPQSLSQQEQAAKGQMGTVSWLTKWP